MQYHTCHLVHDRDPGLDAGGEDTMGTCELSELGEGYGPWGDGGDDGEPWRQQRHGTAIEQGFRWEGALGDCAWGATRTSCSGLGRRQWHGVDLLLHLLIYSIGGTSKQAAPVKEIMGSQDTTQTYYIIY